MKFVKIEVASMEEGLIVDPEGGSLDKVKWNPLYVRNDKVEVVEPDKQREGTCTVVFTGRATPVWVRWDAEALAKELSD